MKRAAIAGGATAVLLLLVALGVRSCAGGATVPEPPAKVEAPTAEGPPPAPAAYQGFLYGRVTAVDGSVYEGRLRFGGHDEAFWSDFFSGQKKENAWAALVPPGRLPRETHAIEIFGLRIFEHGRSEDLDRLLRVPFGDLARLEVVAFETIRATLRSGTTVDLDGMEAGDFDDGVFVWDAGRGAVDLGRGRIRAIELLPTPPLAGLPARLHGTVRTKRGELTGFVQWDRRQSTGDDELEGRAADGAVRLRFDAVRSVARRADRLFATLRVGREVALAGRPGGEGSGNVAVDVPGLGRALVSWDAFERLDLSPAADSGPARDDFEPGRPLAGRVTTRDGRSLSGRIVFDLDESESTDTLDAPRDGIDYSIPFARVAAIVTVGEDGKEAAPVRVRLHDGTTLDLERAGDVGERNAGLLVFVEKAERPEYLLWSEVRQLDLDPPPTPAPKSSP